MRRESNSQFKWILREPPTNDADGQATNPAYLIYSARWPDAVLFILQKVACSSSLEGGDNLLLANDSNSSNMTEKELDDFLNDPNNSNLTLPEGWEFQNDSILDLETMEVDRPELELASSPRRLQTHRRRGFYGGTSCRLTRSPLTRYVQGNWWGAGSDPPLYWLTMYFQKAPKVHRDANPGVQLVMMKNSQDSYLYIPTYGIYGFAGWGTRGQYGDPGANGYFYFDPKLPDAFYDALPSYTGQTCWLACGEVSKDVTFVGAASRLAPVAALPLGLAALLVLVLLRVD